MPINNINNGDSGLSVRGIINSVIDFINNITKSDVGLGNVDNTSDANKPISTATQTALNSKQDTITNTDSISEGSTNLFFTAARSIGSTLTGFATAVVSASISATDTVLVAFGKIQKYMDDNVSSMVVLKTTDQANTLDTAAEDVTDLVVPVLAATRYIVRGHARIGCSGSGGVKFTSTVPSGTTLFITFFGKSTGFTAYTSSPQLSSGSLSTALSNQTNQNQWVEFKGTITTGANAGNFQLQFASFTTAQISTVYSEGTYLELIPMVP